MPQRLPPGAVRDAIFDFLIQRGGEADLREIQSAVKGRFNGTLRPSSVRSYLRLNTPGQFKRTGRGRYQIKQAFLEFSAGAKPTTRAAYVYSNCRLYQADCLEWMANQAENAFQAVVTDPPYGLVEYSAEQQQKLREKKGGVWRIPPCFDGHQRSPLPRFTVLEEEDLLRLASFFREWGRQCFRVLVPGAHIALASNPLLSHRVSMALVDAGFERRGEIIRLVMTMRGGDRPKGAHQEFAEVSVLPRSMWEPWLLFRKPIEGRVQDNLRKWKTGGLRRPSPGSPFCDVIRSHPTRKDERRIAPHPSLKPQAFLRKLVRGILPLGEGIVLDPFAGSGSTLAAAEAVGYASIGVEKDPHYVAMARESIPPLARYLPSDSR